MTHTSRSHLSRLPLLTCGLLAPVVLLWMPASASASHFPEVDQMRAVQAVAHKLEEATSYVHHLAEQREHHYDGREERALEALHELDEAAEHFHEQVERYCQNPYHTEADYARLERSYADAYRAFFGLHAFRQVERAFTRVASLMDDLRYYYTEPRYDEDRGGYRGQGQYRGHGEYRRHGEVRRQGEYRRYGDYDRSPRSHSGAHYRGCGHEGFSIRIQFP